MKKLFARSLSFAALALLGLGASTTLTGCFDKEDDDDGPDGSVCSIAATVVDQSSALALRLDNGLVLLPTGQRWADFHAKAGEKVLIGYRTEKKNGHGNSHQSGCAAGSRGTELGCISLAPGSDASSAAPAGGN